MHMADQTSSEARPVGLPRFANQSPIAGCLQERAACVRRLLERALCVEKAGMGCDPGELRARSVIDLGTDHECTRPRPPCMRVRWVQAPAPETGAQGACWRAEFATMVRLREFVVQTADGVALWEHVPMAPAPSRRLKDGERVATVDRSRIPKNVWPREGGDAPAVPDVRHAEPSGDDISSRQTHGRSRPEGRLEAAPNAAALGSAQKMRALLTSLSLTYAEQSKQIQARSAGY